MTTELPKHIDHVPDNRKAVAPYNFVELPDKIVEAEPLPDGDSYSQESEHQINGKTIKISRLTGKIRCTLTLESQIYIRCGWKPEDYAKYAGDPPKDMDDDEKKAWEKAKREILAPFFQYPDSQSATIPGSSLRGMLRLLVEIVTFGKITRVSQDKLFYRSLGDRAIQDIYAANFIEKKKLNHPYNQHQKIDCYCSKVRAGILRKRNNSWIIEECQYGRIDRGVIGNGILYNGRAPSQTPNWSYQHKPVYIQIDAKEQDYFFPKQINPKTKQKRHDDLYLRYRKVHALNFDNPQFPHEQPAILVITGNMQFKHLEFAFLNEKIDEHEVSDAVWQRFHDDDQVTKWQKEAFKKDKPFTKCREQDGHLRDGEPIFFLLNDDNSVRFMGRAQMFRLPYDLSPFEFVPEWLKDESKTDIADAIFGYVDGKSSRDKAHAGRVFITDATTDTKVQNTNQIEILLSSPKPTTFQHYLVQKSDKRDQLKHYASKQAKEDQEGETTIRGHKLYWHKGKDEVKSITGNSESQTSLIEPINPNSNTKFTFDIYFENLSKVELGALLWVLSIGGDKAREFSIGKEGEDYRLSLGMGKPLGMGAVKIDPTLYISDRHIRYSSLFNTDNNQWAVDEDQAESSISKQKEYLQAFERYVLDENTGIAESDHPQGKRAENLKEIPRIEMLLAMLRWDIMLDAEQTRYMTIAEKEYQNRPVLPTPLQIAEIPDNRRSVSESDSNPKSKSNPTPKPVPKSNSSGNIEKPITQQVEKPIKKGDKNPRKEPPSNNSGNIATERGPKPTKGK